MDILLGDGSKLLVRCSVLVNTRDVMKVSIPSFNNMFLQQCSDILKSSDRSCRRSQRRSVVISICSVSTSDFSSYEKDMKMEEDHRTIWWVSFQITDDWYLSIKIPSKIIHSSSSIAAKLRISLRFASDGKPSTVSFVPRFEESLHIPTLQSKSDLLQRSASRGVQYKLQLRRMVWEVSAHERLIECPAIKQLLFKQVSWESIKRASSCRSVGTLLNFYRNIGRSSSSKYSFLKKKNKTRHPWKDRKYNREDDFRLLLNSQPVSSLLRPQKQLSNCIHSRDNHMQSIEWVDWSIWAHSSLRKTKPWRTARFSVNGHCRVVVAKCFLEAPN